MNKEQLKEKIAEYINGELPAEREKEFFRLLGEQGYDPAEIRKQKELFLNMEQIPVPEPGRTMDAGFYSVLDSHMENARRNAGFLSGFAGFFRRFFTGRFAFRLVYSAALLMVGLIAGMRMENGGNMNGDMQHITAEIRDIREMMLLTLVNQPSATERIRMINLTADFESIDDRVAGVLLKTLNTDENVNVRLVSLEALSGFANDPNVRSGLIRSIAKQESPIVQLALAEVMVKLNEKRSVEYLTNLLKKKELDYSVRQRIERYIEVLSS